MKGFRLKKICAIVCVIALVVSSLSVFENKAKAADYSGLAYQEIVNNTNNEFSQTLAGSKIAVFSGTVNFNVKQYQNVGFGELYLAIAGEGVNAGNLKATINGSTVEIEGSGVRMYNAATYLTYEYNVLELTSDGGNATVIIYCPANAGKGTYGGSETPSQEGEQEPSQGGEQVTTPSTNPGVEPVTTTTVSGPAATNTPAMVQGVVAQTEVGEFTIDNSVMVAWASSTDANNVAGYDPTVTSYNVYIYKNNQVVTHIVNATNGGVIGGLSAGNYQAAVAAVNSKGEGALSSKIDFTVKGATLNYTYPVECNGPKTPSGLVIITANPEVQPSVGNETNAIEVAWAASSNAQASSYDATVTGYNIYLFDATTGNPYRRVYVEGIDSTYTAIKSVSAGTYLVYLSALNAAGNESALSAPSISLPSKVTVTGETYDNAQDFGYPDQPTLPDGLEIITEGIDYGFTVAWAADADLTGIKLNLFVDGVCIKSGINDGSTSAYYENRLAAGTYEVEVKAQYTSNNVESFPISKTVTIAADPGITTQTPAQLADPSYSGYVEPETTVKPQESSSQQPQESSSQQPSSQSPQESSSSTQNPPAGETTKTPENEATTPAPTVGNSGEQNTTVAPETEATDTRPGKVKIKKATKKGKKVSVKFAKVEGATGYEVKIYKTKKNAKKDKNAITTKSVAKVKAVLKSKKFQKAKVLYIKVRAYVELSKDISVTGKWSKLRKLNSYKI